MGPLWAGLHQTFPDCGLCWHYGAPTFGRTRHCRLNCCNSGRVGEGVEGLSMEYETYNLG